MKYTIALGAPLTSAVRAFDSAGGGVAGVAEAINNFQESYTTYNVETDSFNFGALKRGYIPMLGAYAFGKIAGRVLR